MSYSHLTLQERYVIYHLTLFGLSVREITRRLERSASTISRELRRNKRLIGPYWHDWAHEQALARRQQARHYRKLNYRHLYRYVIRHIRQHWSPEIITGCLEQAYPGNPQMRISPEGIYRWVYGDALAGGTLYRSLCRQRPKHRKQRRDGSFRGLIPNRVGIEQRPAIVDKRQRCGDWESDTMEGAKGKSGLATHVDRMSR